MLAETFDKNRFLKSRGLSMSHGDVRRLAEILDRSRDVSLQFSNGKRAHFQFIQAPNISGRKRSSLILTVQENESDERTRLFSRSPQQYVDRLAIAKLIVGIEDSREVATINSMTLENLSEALKHFSSTRMASERVSTHSLDL